MDAWVIWLIVAVVFAVAEIVNLSFYLFPFAIGAAAAAVVGTRRRAAWRSSSSPSRCSRA